MENDVIMKAKNDGRKNMNFKEWMEHYGLSMGAASRLFEVNRSVIRLLLAGKKPQKKSMEKIIGNTKSMKHPIKKDMFNDPL